MRTLMNPKEKYIQALLNREKHSVSSSVGAERLRHTYMKSRRYKYWQRVSTRWFITLGKTADKLFCNHEEVDFETFKKSLMP